MQNIFVINPSLSAFDAFDAFHRKLEQTQAISDCFALLGNNADQQMFMGGFGVISDLLDDLKQLGDVLTKKFEANN
jgi:hypothetical protein